jgi:hypothetical protein
MRGAFRDYSSGTEEASAVTALVKQSSGARVMPAPI